MKLYNALKEIRWEDGLTFINQIITPTHKNNHFAAFILICDACNFIFFYSKHKWVGIGATSRPLPYDERKSVISHI